jgi:hypothetical protein
MREMCRSCYETLDKIFKDRDPHKMQHHVFLMVSDGMDPKRYIEIAQIPCNLKLEPIRQYVASLSNVNVVGSGVSPKLRLRIIKLSPTIPVVDFNAYKTDLIRQIELHFHERK